jgi:hypothetical protein
MKSFYNYIKENKENEFIKDLNSTANEIFEKKNFYPAWKLIDKYPDIISKKEFENTHDRLLVPLSNSNIIKKRITYSEKIRMLFGLLMSKENINYKGDFFNWMENGYLKVYRGTPKKPKDDYLPPNNYLSFTLSKKYAEKFMQSSWAYGGWVQEDVSGYIITANISIKNNFHIYNNSGWEEEIVVKGLLTFDKIEEKTKTVKVS